MIDGQKIPNRSLLIVAIIGTFLITALLISYGSRLWPESTPVSRGAIHANIGSCIACHGQPVGDFPDDAVLDCEAVTANPVHPGYDGKCSDLLAYFEVVRLKRSFASRAESPHPNRLLQGELLARKYNCFQCHGELGQGGFHNAGALKGYIPGYFGNDFVLLTDGGSARSVQTWISTGIDPGLYAKPIEGAVAKFFIERQAINMPIFGTLPGSKIQVLTDYVIALNRFGKMDAQAIRAYSHLTQSLQEQIHAYDRHEILYADFGSEFLPVPDYLGYRERGHGYKTGLIAANNR